MTTFLDKSEIKNKSDLIWGALCHFLPQIVQVYDKEY